jgi:bifunctional enzyme CysN/CysC
MLVARYSNRRIPRLDEAAIWRRTEGTYQLNKPSLPTDPQRLDGQAIETLREVSAEFAFFASAGKGKSSTGNDHASISGTVTSMLAEAVDQQAHIVTLADKPQQRADAFAAHLVWLSEAPLLPGRSYLLKAGAQTVGAMVTELKYRLDIKTMEHLAAKELHRDEIAFVNVATVDPIAFDPYEQNRIAGGFILVDRHSNATVAAGMIRFGLRRAANTYFQYFEVTKTARARLNGQKPVMLWFTGLSGAGKSTIANNLE